jgi:hypothetical protein
MNRIHHIATGIMLLLVLPLGALQNLQPTPLHIGSGTIAELKGKVSLQSPQGPVSNAQRGTVLPPETTIETDKGSILLDLQDGSQVLVKSHSHVVLKSPNEAKGYWLELLLGKIVAKVQKRLGETPSFRMGTPTAVITVRGTRFSVEVTKKHRTIVEVFEGLVQVEGFGLQTHPVLIRPGFSTGVNLGREPDEPRQQGGFGEGSGLNSGPEGDRQAPGTHMDNQENRQMQPGPGGQSSAPPEAEHEHR